MTHMTSGLRPEARAGGGAKQRPTTLLIGLVLAAMCLTALWPAQRAVADHDNYCYAVANPSNNNTLLTIIDKFDFNANTNETSIGSTGTVKTDGIAFRVSTGELYGSEALMGSIPEPDRRGYIGVYDLQTGAFTRHPNPLQSSSTQNQWPTGSLGHQNVYDISGMAFDPANGVLYVSHVRSTAGQASLLLQVNTTTGRVIEDAFGAGLDYVPMTPLGSHGSLHIMDDIAIDPTDSQMYGILNNTSYTGDRLVKINKATGALTDVGPLGVGNVEGLDFDPHGRLWATRGTTGASPDWFLYEVNKETGAASSPRPLNNSSNYEALACMLGGSVVEPTNSPTPTRTATSGPPPTVDPSLDERLYLPAVHN